MMFSQIEVVVCLPAGQGIPQHARQKQGVARHLKPPCYWDFRGHYNPPSWEFSSWGHCSGEKSVGNSQGQKIGSGILMTYFMVRFMVASLLISLLRRQKVWY